MLVPETGESRSSASVLYWHNGHATATPSTRSNAHLQGATAVPHIWPCSPTFVHCLRHRICPCAKTSRHYGNAERGSEHRERPRFISQSTWNSGRWAKSASRLRIVAARAALELDTESAAGRLEVWRGERGQAGARFTRLASAASWTMENSAPSARLARHRSPIQRADRGARLRQSHGCTHSTVSAGRPPSTAHPVSCDERHCNRTTGDRWWNGSGTH